MQNLVATKGEVFPWNGFYWRVLDQVTVEGRAPDGAVQKVGGLVIIPTEPTNGALKKWAGAQKLGGQARHLIGRRQRRG